MYNFIIVISLIIFIFFISADKKITKDIIQKNSLHIILFLLLIYFVYNNLHLGFLLLIILVLVLYYTNLKHFFYNYINKPSKLDSLDMWRDVFNSFNWMDIINNHKNIDNKNNESNQYLKQVNEDDIELNNEYNDELNNEYDIELNDVELDEDEDEETLDNLMEVIDEELST